MPTNLAQTPSTLSQFSAGGPGFGEEWSISHQEFVQSTAGWWRRTPSSLSLFAVVCKSAPLRQRQAPPPAQACPQSPQYGSLKCTMSQRQRSLVETCCLTEYLSKIWHIHTQLTYSYHEQWTTFDPLSDFFSCILVHNWNAPHFNGNTCIVGSIHVDSEWHLKMSSRRSCNDSVS